MKLNKFINFLTIILAIPFLISDVLAVEIQLLCLEQGETAPFSKCNPVMQDRYCSGGECQYCVTYDEQNNIYCPANINICNMQQNLQCSRILEINDGSQPEDNQTNNSSINRAEEEVKADIAYIIKNEIGIDNFLLNELKNNEFSYDIIFESEISNTDLSKYHIIMIGNQNLNNPEAIPNYKFKSFVINSYDYYKSGSNWQLGWSGGVKTVSSPSVLHLRNNGHPIASGIPKDFNAYNIKNSNIKANILNGAKPKGIDIIIYSGSLNSDAVVAVVHPGMAYLNGKIAMERAVFFGIPYSEFWTADSKKIFKNSLEWLVADFDLDNDGFFSDIDCNDRDPKINPNSKDPAFNCINDPPIIAAIQSMTFAKGEKVVINVEARDPENDVLFYEINDPRFKFNNADKSFSWQPGLKDAGDYRFKITVSDGKISTDQIVNVKVRKSLFKLEDIPEIIWNEDSSYILNLNEYLSNPENDDIIFSIKETTPNNNIFLDSFSNGVFILAPNPDWFGEDWIIFKISNGDESIMSNKINLKVSGINDAPRIKSYLPDSDFVKIANGQKKTFVLNTDNIDNEDLNIKWHLNNIYEGEGASYVFSKTNGFYTVSAIVSDSLNSVQKFWNILVAEPTQLTCSEIGGSSCAENQICASPVSTIDNSLCCTVECTAKPLVFNDFPNCSTLNESLKLRIKYPDENDEIKSGDTIGPEIEIESDLNQDLDLDIDISLYDLTKNKSIEEDGDSVELKEGRREVLRFKLNIPEDLDLSHEYALIVIAKDGMCNQKQTKLKIEKPKDKIIIKDFELPDSISCGDVASGRIKIENVGSNDQEISLSLESNKLNIKEKFDNIDLEESGQDDDFSKELAFAIPDNILSGKYTIIANIRGTVNLAETKEIEVKCDEQILPLGSSGLDTISPLNLDGNNKGGIGINSEDEKPNTLVVLIMLLATFTALGFLFFVYKISKKEKE